MEARNTEGPAAKPKRYRLVSSRVSAQNERIKRFKLTQMDGLPRLERLEPARRANPGV